MEIIKNLLQGILNKIESSQQNEDSTGTPQKNFIPYIAGVVAIIVVFLFVGGKPDSPKDIAEKYENIAIRALNEGKISDDDIKWVRELYVNPVMGEQEAANMRQTANLNKNLAQLGSSMKVSLKEIKVIDASDIYCVVGIKTELTGVSNGMTNTAEGQVKIYFTKTDSWKISRIESH